MGSFSVPFRYKVLVSAAIIVVAVAAVTLIATRLFNRPALAYTTGPAVALGGFYVAFHYLKGEL